MSDRELPARPKLEQYKKQAKDLARDFSLGVPGALARVKRHHPRLYFLDEAALRSARLRHSDALLVTAREHGFESWPKLAKHVETLRLIESVNSIEAIADPVAAFIEVACVPRHASHTSGTIDHAEMVLARFPWVRTSTIHAAAILGDDAIVRALVTEEPKSATRKGGPYGWDPMTHLCFSRYLRLDAAYAAEAAGTRPREFVRAAEALLDAGASANTGWYEMVDYPKPHPIFESVIYGAAGMAGHPGLTRLLLERGADPNDDETPYHVPERYDNTVMHIMVESGRLTPRSMSWMLVRKSDWHDRDGVRYLLEHGADPNLMTLWRHNPLHHALRRDNELKIIELMLDHGADPALKNAEDGRSAAEMSAFRGRGDVLAAMKHRGILLTLEGLGLLVAACAEGDRKSAGSLVSSAPSLVSELMAEGGGLLARFAGNGNVEGMKLLLELGVSPQSLYEEGDPYFDIAKASTALHVAAWRARPAAVKELIARGAPVNALDGKARTALALAVKACVDSYWKDRRTPMSVEALLAAGAMVDGIKLPSGYEEIDELLRKSG